MADGLALQDMKSNDFDIKGTHLTNLERLEKTNDLAIGALRMVQAGNQSTPERWADHG